MLLTPGTVIAQRYHVLRRIGEGGQARVFLAEDTVEGSLVALKPQEETALGFAHRHDLRHPSLLRCLGLIRGDRDILVEEFVEGPSWETRSLCPPEEIFRLAVHLLTALDYLNERGLAHRDIKPGNILDAPNAQAIQSEGTIPVLIDFGLCTPLDQGVTRSGTLGSIAPEVLASQDPTKVSWVSADLFGLGTTLLALSLGTKPDIRWSVEPARLDLILEGVPASLRPLLRGLTSRNPKSRFASAAEALRVVEPLAEIQTVADPSAWPLVGQDDVLDSGFAFLQRDAVKPKVLCVKGETGSGRTRLAQTLAHRLIAHSMTATVVESVLDTPESLSRVLTHLDDGQDVILTTASDGAALHLEIALGDPARVSSIEPQRLSSQDVESLLRYLPGATSFDAQSLCEKSGGHPQSLADLLRPTNRPRRVKSSAVTRFLSVLAEPFRPPETHDSLSRQDFLKSVEAGGVRALRDGRFSLPSPDIASRIREEMRTATLHSTHELAAECVGEESPYYNFHVAMSGNDEETSSALSSLAADERMVPERVEWALEQLWNTQHRAVLDADREALAQVCRRLLEASRLAMVESITSEVASRDSAEEGLEGLRGILLARKGKFDEAARVLSAAHQNGALSGEAILDLARVQLNVGRLPEALQTVDRGLEQASSESPDAFLAELGRIRSLVLFRLGDTQSAICQAQESLSGLANTPPTSLSLGLLQNLGMMYRHRGDLEGACQAFEEAAEGFRRLGDIRSSIIVTINAAIALQDEGQLKRALQKMVQARDQADRLGLGEPRDVARIGAGITLGLLGESAEACQELEDVEEALRSSQRVREASLARLHHLHNRRFIEERDEDRDELHTILRDSLESELYGIAAVAWRIALDHGDTLEPFSTGSAKAMLRAAEREVREAILIHLVSRRPTREIDTRRRLTSLAKNALPRNAVLAWQCLLARDDTSLSSEDRVSPLAQLLNATRHSQSAHDVLNASRLAIEMASRLDRRIPKIHLKRMKACVSTLRNAAPTHTGGPMMSRWNEQIEQVSGLVDRLAKVTPRDSEGTHPDVVPLFEACRVIQNSELTDSERCALILKDALRISKAQRGVIVTRSPGGEETCEAMVMPKSGEDFHLSRSLLDEVLATGHAKMTNNALEDPDFRHANSVVAFKLSSIACVPIRIGRETLGALYVDNAFERGVFDEATLEYLEVFASQIAMHLDAQWKTREITRLNAELREDLETTKSELESARQTLKGDRLTPMIYESEVMVRLMKLVRRFASSQIPVFIHGETGSGKELVARRLHEHSPRHKGPFVSENCAAIPKELLESELFGHVKGAFSGATRDKPGLMRAASGGTLFLDEIGDMPLSLQGKILRALQEGKVRPVGGDETLDVDVRLITATHRDLRKMVEDGEFREDLFYRIYVAPIEVPALRQRRADIPLLASYFLKRYGTPDAEFSAGALAMMEQYEWPGNVRELESAVRSASVMARDATILPDDLPETIRTGRTVSRNRSVPCTNLKRLERLAVSQALEEAEGNRMKAAHLLGISRSSLFNKLREYGLTTRTTANGDVVTASKELSR